MEGSRTGDPLGIGDDGDAGGGGVQPAFPVPGAPLLLDRPRHADATGVGLEPQRCGLASSWGSIRCSTAGAPLQAASPIAMGKPVLTLCVCGGCWRVVC